MTDVFIPFVTNTSGSTPSAKKRVVIDPLTRIEGHLRIELQIDNGVVTDAWSSSTMFRGLELILQNRDPREAWMLTQRICGVCTTVHAIASVRAVENALNIQVPDNARILRNLIEGALYLQDHVVHFYNLHALDWVDIVSALSASPAATAALQQSISDWHNNTPDYFTTVQNRLQNFVASGQIGLFANGYWGHPAYKLPPEGNLLAAAHYLEALDWQREFIKMEAILGGKNPHSQTYLVGGMATPLSATTGSINPARINLMRTMVNNAIDFVTKVYYPDLKLVASFYKDWASLGAGVGNFLSYGDFPQTVDNDPAHFFLPRGVVSSQQIGSAPSPMDQALIQEYITHSWYTYAGGDTAGAHPSVGQTAPNFTGPTPPFDQLNVDGKYSWLKAPRYQDAPMEVGPLARMVVAYAGGHPQVTAEVNNLLAALSVPAAALFSTLGRTTARGVETVVIANQMLGWLDQLEANITAGDLQIHNSSKWLPSSWPSQMSGFGWTEAPRGALGHWVTVQNRVIKSYQMVVPSTWNGSPRDAASQSGPWEKALIGTPIADPQRPLEVLRTIHSFDPCMACAVHLVDTRGRELTRVETF